MTKQEFVDLVVNNHKTGQWINGTFNVDGHAVGIKAFGKWVQVMKIGNFKDGTVEVNTVKYFRSLVENLYDQLAKCQN